MGPETVMNWSKFIVYFKLQDPYLWPAMTGKISELMQRFQTDQMLVVLVNWAQSLTPEASGLFSAVSEYFASKLNVDYTPSPGESILTEEDVPKLMTVFGSYRMLKPELVDAVSSYVEDNSLFLKFSTLADLAMIYAQYWDAKQVIKFLEENENKILSNLPYASDKIFCILENNF